MRGPSTERCSQDRCALGLPLEERTFTAKPTVIRVKQSLQLADSLLATHERNLAPADGFVGETLTAELREAAGMTELRDEEKWAAAMIAAALARIHR